MGIPASRTAASHGVHRRGLRSLIVDLARDLRVEFCEQLVDVHRVARWVQCFIDADPVGAESLAPVVPFRIVARRQADGLLGAIELAGLVLIVAGLVNLVVGMLLLRVGIRERSITLEADGRHLLTDVWTSAGVVLGVGLVALTGWAPLDAIVAMAVAANIVLSGFGLIRRSVRGLLDASLPPDQVEQINAVLRTYSGPLVQFHALRTRQAGRRSFVSFHMLVPGDQSVLEAHDIVERVEAELAALIDGLSVISHIEPLEDPRSYADEGLDNRPS